jgi:hypothetical protein
LTLAPGASARLFYTDACPPRSFADGCRNHFLGSAVPNDHSRTTPRTLRNAPFLRRSLLALLVAGATTASAQQQEAEPGKPSWLDGVRAQCEQQYSAEQCQDHEFLNQNFHVDSLQAAHRTAIKRRSQEETALRELLLQRACTNRQAYCAQSGAAGCAAQLAQMCTAIAQQAKACIAQAKQFCATYQVDSNCVSQRQLQCPSAKKQSIDALLVKYPKLSTQQQLQIRQAALRMDSDFGGSWIGDLFRRLGF